MLRSVTRFVKAPASKVFKTPARSAHYYPPMPVTDKNLHFGSVDGQFEQCKLEKDVGEPNNRDFAYLVIGGSRFVFASAARFIVLKLLATWAPARDTLALGTSEFDCSAVREGQSVVVKWRGKPVFVRHRTADEIASARSVDMSSLIDPETDEARVKEAEWLIVVGVCTHLGCVPISNAGDYGGWFCPCHGSHYDISGRIRKGPAPLNLAVPPYSLTDGQLVIG